MDYWPWDPALDLGIETIDLQHRRIVDNINRLHMAQMMSDRDKVREVLIDLIDYTKTHFTFEEELMEKFGYPDLDSHKGLHKAFIVRIKKRAHDHIEGQDVAPQLTADLKAWLLNHIKKDDREYAPLVLNSLDSNNSWIGRAVKRLFD